MKNGTDLIKILSRAGYDEAAYLDANPDVARAVRNGEFPSGWRHFLDYGVIEGRKGVPDRACQAAQAMRLGKQLRATYGADVSSSIGKYSADDDAGGLSRLGRTLAASIGKLHKAGPAIHKPKVCLFGTSNAITTNGWTSSFLQASRARLTRFCLGGAPFTQFLHCLDIADLLDVDCFIVECSPNDETDARFIGDEAFFFELYEAFIQTLTRIAPVFIVRIPPETSLSRQSEIFERQQTIWNRFGCRIIDLQDFFLSESSNYNNDIYVDHYHPNTQILISSGELIASIITNDCASKYSPDPKQAEFGLARIRDGRFNVSTIENRLINEQFKILNEGDTHIFDEEIFCLGFFVDTSKTQGVVRLEGSNGSREIHCYYRHLYDSPTMHFVPVRNGFPTRSVTVARRDETLELGLFSDFPRPPYHAALAGFSYRRATIAYNAGRTLRA